MFYVIQIIGYILVLLWRVKYLVRKLNDILDLNEGEKEMMNMWNEFIHDIHGRCLLHVNAIVNSFIEQRAHVIFQRNLYR